MNSLPISLTSIPSRLDILPRTLRALLKQTLKPSAIHIWLSKDSYQLDGGCSEDLPRELRELLATEPIYLHWTDNLGPFTKLLPFCNQYPDTPVLVVDDDTIYDENLVLTAYTLWNQHKCCIAFRATIYSKEHYRLWPNASDKKDVNIFHKGNGGVVYHTKWFQDPLFHNAEVYKKLCPTADDIWINLWRMKKGILCYCYARPLIKSSIPVKTTLFHFNESNNDRILNDVREYVSFQ